MCMAGLALAIGPVTSASAQKSDDQDVAQLAERAAKAHERLMRGDIEGYREVMEVTPDFTLMDPMGGKPTGAPANDEHWARIGSLFANGRDASFDLIASYVSEDLVVLVANEHAHVAFRGLPAQRWSLRVTLVFRRSGLSWQLAHRHADPLASGIRLSEAAGLARGD
jgi:ketosteroid isomerase-like protein